jgi:DUF1016 N-terminal domain
MPHESDLSIESSSYADNASRPITLLSDGKISDDARNDQSLSSEEYGAVLVDVTRWLEQARKQAGRAVNVLMIATYWRIGERIFEQEQRGDERTGYGERIVAQFARDLSARFGRGFLASRCFKCDNFTLPAEPKSSRNLDF